MDNNIDIFHAIILMETKKICSNWSEILKECGKKKSLPKNEQYNVCLQRMSDKLNCKIPVVNCGCDGTILKRKTKK
jgi:hypothetical protein